MSYNISLSEEGFIEGVAWNLSEMHQVMGKGIRYSPYGDQDEQGIEPIEDDTPKQVPVSKPKITEEEYKNTIEELTRAVPNKIKILVIPDTEERKPVHQYLDVHYPNLNKSSLTAHCFRRDRKKSYKICWNCGYKKVDLDRYHYGSMPNNQDEWKSGTCPRCYESVQHECNYDSDDDMFIIYSNNVIAIGDYVFNYDKRRHDADKSVSAKQVADILKDIRIFEIDEPTERMKKLRFQDYITAQLEQLV